MHVREGMTCTCTHPSHARAHRCTQERHTWQAGIIEKHQQEVEDLHAKAERASAQFRTERAELHEQVCEKHTCGGSKQTKWLIEAGAMVV